MGQEAAGTGGTNRIHPEISHHAFSYYYYLAVLSAYFYYSVYLRHIMQCRGGMTCDLVLYEVSVDDSSGKIPGASGSGHSTDLGIGRQFFFNTDQSLLNLFDRFSLRRHIDARCQVISGIKNSHLGCYRTDIYSKVKFHHTPWTSALRSILFFARLLCFKRSTKASSLVNIPVFVICSSHRIVRPGRFSLVEGIIFCAIISGMQVNGARCTIPSYSLL